MRQLLANQGGVVFESEALELCALLPNGCVDMILCDLPYGTTRNAWDFVIDPARMWEQFRRITKPNAAIVLTAQIPFSCVLAASNLDMLAYEWVWEKNNATGHLNAKKQPMKAHENVLVFYRSPPVYNPQREVEKFGARAKGSISSKSKKRRDTSNYGDQIGLLNPQNGLYVDDGTRYPRSVIQFSNDGNPAKAHPTQKPVELFRYLIRTYTNTGAFVFDPTAGSGTTAIAARAEGRAFMVGDRDPAWAGEIVERLNAPDDRTWAQAAKVRRDAREAVKAA